MTIALWILTTISWAALAFLWHGFWRVDQRLPTQTENLKHWPSIVAVVPARNEEATIRQCLNSLLAQNYAGEFSIIVTDDSSTDSTAETIADMAGDKLKLISAPELPDGWAGKMWAQNCGISQAQKSQPDYYWLTDADISHKTENLSNLVSFTQTNQLALASQMVRLQVETFWEKLLAPAFIFYFTLIYPFRAINNPSSPIAGAAGGSMLIRRDALKAIGGMEALKDAVIDDCTLGKLIKRSGRKIWLGFGEQSKSLRGNQTLASFWQMVQRSAYTQLGFSPLLLAGAIGGIIISHILPVVFFIWPALALMAWIYWPTVRHYGLSPVWAFTLPVAATLFGAMTISSAFAHTFGWSNTWRGRQINKINKTSP